jgi:hypothetical protein
MFILYLNLKAEKQYIMLLECEIIPSLNRCTLSTGVTSPPFYSNESSHCSPSFLSFFVFYLFFISCFILSNFFTFIYAYQHLIFCWTRPLSILLTIFFISRRFFFLLLFSSACSFLLTIYSYISCSFLNCFNYSILFFMWCWGSNPGPHTARY